MVNKYGWLRRGNVVGVELFNMQHIYGLCDVGIRNLLR